MKFIKATKKQAHARVALIGISGSGKTYSSLRIAGGLAPRGRIAVIDSERGSASKYSDLFAFDVLELESFAPLEYVRAIDAAAAEKFDVLVIDSLSHAWMGKDGALEQVDRRASGAGSSFNAWRDVTPMHNRLVDALIRFPGHLIVTMRAKSEYVVEQNGKGKSVPRKVGMAPVQRDGLEYEFDLVVELAGDQSAIVSKTRCPAFNGAAIEILTEDTGTKLRAWLTDGAPMPAQVAPASTGTGKLPPTGAAPAPAKQAAAAPPQPATPPPPFDLARVKAQIAMADTREEAIQIATDAGVALQPEQLRAAVKQAIKDRSAEIDKERTATAGAAQPANDTTPKAEAAPAPVADVPSDAGTAIDPGFASFLADIQPAVGEITEHWTTNEAIEAWRANLHFSADRAQLDALCLPWLTAAQRRGGAVVASLRDTMTAEYKARRRELPSTAAGAAA